MGPCPFMPLPPMLHKKDSKKAKKLNELKTNTVLDTQSRNKQMVNLRIGPILYAVFISATLEFTYQVTGSM